MGRAYVFYHGTKFGGPRDDAGRKRAYRKRVREELIKSYGGSCACCGEQEFRFLGLDHINGGGGKHRARTCSANINGMILSGKLSRDDYQILCHNCNLAKGFYGVCPHKERNP